MKRYIILYLYLVWIFGIHAQSYPGGTGNIASPATGPVAPITPTGPVPINPTPIRPVIPNEELSGLPIFIGTKSENFTYTDTKNTANTGNNYTGRSPNDVKYQFTLDVPMEIVANHCGSDLSDTYMHLLDAPALGESARLIVSNDNYSGEGHCPNTGHAYIKQRLPAGSYYIVSEGFNSNGNITTTITGRIIPVTGVSLNTANLSLLTGATSQLTVRFAPADATNQAVSWTSSNTAVATVSDAGLVTARTTGTTTITVTTADGARTATCTVTVTVPVYAYSVNGNGGTVSGGTQAGNYPAGTTITLPASAKHGYSHGQKAFR